MGKHALTAPGARARALLGAAAALIFLFVSPAIAQAQTREYQLRWRVPPESDVARYHVFVGQAPRSYAAPFVIDAAQPDASGVAATLLTGLDSTRDYYVAMSALDTSGNESVLSNEVRVAAVPCSAAQCDDGNSCTVDSCGASACQYAVVPDGTGCDDRDTTTFFDRCSAGACLGQRPQCQSDADCPDTDANVCSGRRRCQDFVCVATAPLVCPAPNDPCRAASCNAVSGCGQTNAPNGTTCSDGNASTVNDACSNGACVGTPAQCTSDAQCPDTDANVCSGGRRCQDFACVATAPLVCPVQSDACRAASCDPVTGCGQANAPNGTTCSDGNAATVNDACSNGACVGIPAQCTSDAQCPDTDANVCNGKPECQSFRCVAGPAAPNGTACDDGDPSTLGDVCAAGACGGSHECESNADCADPDADVCTGTPICSGFRCVPGAPLVCDAAPVCGASACDPVSGCGVRYDPVGTPCDDGDASTQSDACVADGVCAGEVSPPPPPPDDTCATAFGPATARRLSLGDRADTEMTVVWDAPANPAGAEIRYRRDGSRRWFSLPGERIRQDGCNATFAAELAGLWPDTDYDYAVSGAGDPKPHWSTVERFETAPRTGSSNGFRVVFVAGTGSPGAPDAAGAALVRDRIARLRPNLLLGGGGYAFSNDVIGAGLAPDAGAAVARWFEQMSPALARVPFLPAFGDSEHASYWHGEQAALYAERHPLPVADGAPGRTYSYDVANAHFLAVDAPSASALLPETPEGASHLAWIEADLAAARARGARWLVVYLHIDLWSSEAGATPVQSVRDALGRLFEAQRVNLVLSGDGNSTERTWPLVNGERVSARRRAGGVIYLRAGSGGRSEFGTWASPTAPATTAMRDARYATLVVLRFSGRDPLVATTLGLDTATGEARELDRVELR